MKSIVPFLLCIVGLVTWGCAPTAPAEKSADAAQTTSGGDTKAMADTADNSTGMPDIPQELQHMGLEYSGVGKVKELFFDVKMGSEGDAREGIVKIQDIKLEGNELTFQRVNSGALEATGTETLKVTKDGVFVTALSSGKIDPIIQELPHNLAPGAEWTQKTTLEMGENKFNQDLKLKAVKMEKVKTPAGEFEALKIESSGEMAIGENKSKITADFWYVKGIGMVKINTKMEQPGGVGMSQEMVLKSFK